MQNVEFCSTGRVSNNCTWILVTVNYSKILQPQLSPFRHSIKFPFNYLTEPFFVLFLLYIKRNNCLAPRREIHLYLYFRKDFL